MKTKFKGILTLFLAIFVQIAFAQEKTVSGTVSESSGVLPGVSVSLKGTATGTETDFDGKYSIRTKVGDILVFSYLGYKRVERTVGNSNTINVTLEQDDNVLDEIVVTGVATGTSTKKLGFSLTKVDTESLQQVPATDAANALRGKVAGVRIVQPSGNPATAASIRLRGSTSISGSQSPLIIVDGIITSGNLKDIPVEDIESICNTPFELFKIKKDEASFNNVDFPTFKIPFFVTFYVTNGKKEFIKNNVCKKDE